MNYDRLWKLLIDRKLKKTDLVYHTGISSATLAKMSKNQLVSMETIIKICSWLKCDISDICVINFEAETRQEVLL